VVQLDQKNQAAKNRAVPITVFLQGPLRSVLKAAKLLSNKIESVSEDRSGSGLGSGVNRTVLVIPNGLVRRVIGRGGSSIAEIQTDSKASMQLQSEAKM
jgi:hypothetical protein